MHAQTSNQRKAGDCPSCSGSGRTSFGLAADRVLKLPESERAAAFEGLDYNAQVALYDQDVTEWRRLSGDNDGD